MPIWLKTGWRTRMAFRDASQHQTKRSSVRANDVHAGCFNWSAAGTKVATVGVSSKACELLCEAFEWGADRRTCMVPRNLLQLGTQRGSVLASNMHARCPAWSPAESESGMSGNGDRDFEFSSCVLR